MSTNYHCGGSEMKVSCYWNNAAAHCERGGCAFQERRVDKNRKIFPLNGCFLRFWLEKGAFGARSKAVGTALRGIFSCIGQNSKILQ